MTTHRFFVDATQINGGAIAFRDDQAHQIQHVLRLRAGDRVRVFDGLEPLDRLVELNDTGRASIVDKCAQRPEPRTRLIAYPALLQRDKIEPVLQKLTEIGVAAVCPVITARSLVREAPDERRTARWRAILREATEQSGRGVVPQLQPTQDFTAALASSEGTTIIAHEGDRRHQLRDALVRRPNVVSVFVGPEGGYTLTEVDCARQAGAAIVRLGPRVLRTETASPLLAGLVLYELGDLT